jgi:hypothetical protein
MALTSGTRLGLYEILGKLGEGGPAFADRSLRSQLRRGLAEAKETIR